MSRGIRLRGEDGVIIEPDHATTVSGARRPRGRPSPLAGRKKCLTPGCRRLRARSRSRCRGCLQMRDAAAAVCLAALCGERRALVYDKARRTMVVAPYCAFHLTHNNARRPLPRPSYAGLRPSVASTWEA